MDKESILQFKRDIPELVNKDIISAKTAHALTEYYNQILADIEKPAEAVADQASPAPELDAAFTELTPQAITPAASPAPEEKAPQATSEQTPATSKKSAAKPKLSVSVILTVIAGILISTGIISLIAYNWAAIPRLAKAITAIVLLLATQITGLVLVKTGKAAQPKIREGYSVFWGLLFGGIVAFVSQIFRFGGNTSSFLFVWAASAIMITYLFKAHTSYFLALLLTVIFGFYWVSDTARLLILPLCAALYFPARKAKSKVIPLFIFAAIFYLITLTDADIPGNVKNAILTLIISSIGFILLQKSAEWKKYTGMGLLGFISFGAIFLWRPFPKYSSSINTAADVLIIILVSFIAAGFFFEGVLLPVIRKIKSKEILSLDSLLYLIPVVISLLPLFRDTADVIYVATASQWYKIFISPLTLAIVYTSLLFVTRASKKSKDSWIFLGFLLLECLKIFTAKPCYGTFVFTLASLFVFLLGTLVWKNNFTGDGENKYILIAARAISAVFLFVIAFCVKARDSSFNFFEASKLPYIVLFCYLPAAIFGLVQLCRFAKKNRPAFLFHLDIFVNLAFALLIFAIAANNNQAQIRFVVNLWIAINFIWSAIFAIKTERYTSLIYTALALVYFFTSYAQPDTRITQLYFVCTALIFAAGLFLWKSNFELTPLSKNSLIIIRVFAVIILFIVNLLARKADSILYTNVGIDRFIFFTITPAAIFGLVMLALFAKSKTKDFLLNIDIFANLFVTAVVLCFTRIVGKDITILTLQILTSLNLLVSCVYIIRSGKYEYAFYILFAVIYFIVVFSSVEFSSTVLYLIITSAIFISGTFLWKNNFEVNESTKMTLLVSKIASMIFLLTTALFTADKSPVLFGTQGITNYILICFTPAAVFGLILYAYFAYKNPEVFRTNFDIAVNFVFTFVLYIFVHKFKPESLLFVLEIMMILNLAAALYFFVFENKNEAAVYFIACFLYYLIKLGFTEKTNGVASAFLTISVISLFAHYYAQRKNIMPLKLGSTIATGIVLFYESAMRSGCEGDLNYISWNFYSIAFLSLCGLAAICFAYFLIQEKIIFNPAIFLAPVVVIVLTRITDKYSILLTLPVILLFCVYYFYLAYKNDSLKIANLSTIYFGLTLMIRFFSSGYGLAIQGITFIVMGILLLVMNILMTKRRERNENN